LIIGADAIEHMLEINIFNAFITTCKGEVKLVEKKFGSLENFVEKRKCGYLSF